jgi:DNA polymerase-3 subunit delta
MAEARFRFVCGNDDFLVSRKGAEIWAANVPSGADFMCVEIVEGRVLTVENALTAIQQCIGALQTMPMFGDRKYVWFKDVSFMGDTVQSKSADVQEGVEKLQSVLGTIRPHEVFVLFTVVPIDRRRRQFKWFQENGNVEFLASDNEKDLQQAVTVLVQELLKASQKSIHPSAMNVFLSKVGSNPRMALAEMQKLITWAGDAEPLIREKHVLELVPDSGEGNFFEAAEAFYAADLTWMLEALRRYFFAGNDIRPLLSTFQGRNRLLLQLRSLYDAGELTLRVQDSDFQRLAGKYGNLFGASDTKSALNPFSQNPWYLKRLMAVLPSFTLKKLVQIQLDLLDVFEEVLKAPAEAENRMAWMAQRHLLKGSI